MNTPGIQLTNLTKRYGSPTAVDDLDLEVPAGQDLGSATVQRQWKSTTTGAGGAASSAS